MSAEAGAELIARLEARFERHPRRHPGVAWNTVRARLASDAAALAALHAMEASGGEPEVIVLPGAEGGLALCDGCAQSPAGRRSLCYDERARLARKEAPPAASAVGIAGAIGVRLLTEAEYAGLQALGEFDTKTSSWLHTPAEVRDRGGALFGDRRFGRVFTYANGAESYFAARGFRGILRL
jgi:hypothetical protein